MRVGTNECTHPPVSVAKLLLDANALELFQRRPYRCYLLVSGLLLTLNLLERVRQIVETTDCFTIRTLDGFNFFECRFDGWLGCIIVMTIAESARLEKAIRANLRGIGYGG